MKDETKENEALPGYPSYPAKDDIYRRAEDTPLPDEEDNSLDSGLDVPGSELDDADEAIGSEDEENNYYSIGGDQHEDLEENGGSSIEESITAD